MSNWVLTPYDMVKQIEHLEQVFQDKHSMPYTADDALWVMMIQQFRRRHANFTIPRVTWDLLKESAEVRRLRDSGMHWEWPASEHDSYYADPPLACACVGGDPCPCEQRYGWRRL